MPIVLFLVFIAVPLIELALIIKVGQVMGFWVTLGLMVGMAILGSMMLRQQGLGVMRKAAEALSEGRPPVAAVIDSVFLFVAGLLMLTPGFLSDALGISLLIPPFRRWLGNAVIRHIATHGEVRVETYEHARYRPGATPSGRPDEPTHRPRPPVDVIIETDYQRLDDPPPNGTPRR